MTQRRQETGPGAMPGRQMWEMLDKMNQRLPEIYDLLYRLGLTANYTGFFHMAYAVYLGLECPERLLLVTKWLYPEVAKHYGTNWKAVERNIRTAIGVIWRENRPLLEELAGRPVPEKPRSAQLLAILVSALGGTADRGPGEACLSIPEDPAPLISG